jgi:asparagine synthase (glutamine-hydrolysing)
VIAFTGVPREGYDGPAPPNGIIDERDNAAATAALHPNIEHVVVPNEGCSPLADLDRIFFLFDRPVRRLCATGWAKSFNQAVRDRKLGIVLSGGAGNFGLSYDGLEFLPELFRSGRLLRLWSEAAALVASRRLRWRGVLANTLGPWFPPTLWAWANRLGRPNAFEWRDYVAIHPRRLSQPDLPARAKSLNHDFSYRPWKDGLARRLRVLQSVDPGNYYKGSLADLQVDQRDPTADVRLLEFCFAVPTEQFLRNGVLRALARRALIDRLPKQVLEETRTGLTIADWHEDLAIARDEVVDELDRLEACPAAAAALDLRRLRRLTENWPNGNWQHRKVLVHYRYALLRAIAVGHFLRRATGSNR